ncbi:hypothetical protein AB0M47_02235 [Hamadaea sp. NPDC051192]|uniref:hypothetical protein n=1 Tax=Hamadaea sp. NPDC051192 TaxID=3154940 RepID=UPI003436E8F8
MTADARTRSTTFSGGRLVRLELRRNAMLWMSPAVAVLFWLVVYRRSQALPPLWSLRVMDMQTATVSIFVPVVVGVAAWVGGREARHGLTDLLSTTARSRWARQCVAWAATTGWAVAAYAVCVAVLYVDIGRHAAWGGPLWWPAAVGAASLPAFTAIGFAAGALVPGRFTAPLAAVTAFLALEISANFIHGDHSPWQISPLVPGLWNMGPNPDLATFYPYLPDLARVQLVFLVGVAVMLLGTLGVAASGSRRQRRVAAALTAGGLLAGTVAVALAGTARLDAHGMLAIAAVHDSADDRPVAYTPVCSASEIPVCLHPAYAAALPAVTAALGPVLRDLAGVPGAPSRIGQATVVYRQGIGNGFTVRAADPQMSGDPPVLWLLLPNQVPGPSMTNDELLAALRTQTVRAIVSRVVTDGDVPTRAQQAVIDAYAGTAAAEPGNPAAQAAQRFAALTPDARHAWLVANIAALRAGSLDLEQLP